jgi:hypothetical protein
MVSVKLPGVHRRRPRRIRWCTWTPAAGARALDLSGGAPSTRISVRLGRIGLVDLRIAQVGRLQILLDEAHGIIRFGVDRFLDLDLQDQVSAAAQVQAKVNALGHGLHQGLAGDARRHPEDAVDADHQNHQNSEYFVIEILLHRPVSRYSGQWSVDSGQFLLPAIRGI